MIMKKLSFLVFMLILTSLVFADVGPSPSFSFGVSNANEFSEYNFYYAGNIWPDKFDPVTEETNVYKLNTHIIVYAIQRGQSLEVSNAIASQKIDLKSGHSIFKVESFNETTKQMSLKTEEQVPDTTLSNPIIDYLLMFGVFLLIIFVIVALVFIAKAKK